MKNLIGGDEDTVTAYLAIFSVAVGAGSALAAKIARGRIVLRTTLVGAILLGLFALDLGVILLGATPESSLRGPAEIFSSLQGWMAALDLAGLAVCGRAVHRAGLRGGAGLGRHGLPRADGGGGQRAQRSLHDRRDRAVALLQNAGVTCRSCFC